MGFDKECGVGVGHAIDGVGCNSTRSVGGGIAGGGRWAVGGGQWSVVSGQWSVVGGQRVVSR